MSLLPGGRQRLNSFPALSPSQVCCMATETSYRNLEVVQKHIVLTLLDGYSHYWPHPLVCPCCLPQRGLPSLVSPPDRSARTTWVATYLPWLIQRIVVQSSELPPTRSPSTDNKHSGTSWILSVIITIWTVVQSHWEVWNKMKHGDTKVTRLNSKFAQVFGKMKAL
jgi:hypothetical protein